MRTVLSFCVIIAAAVACPTKREHRCNLPKICPPTWHVKEFESQYATQALQGKWYVQMGSPTLINGNNPLKTGLFCNGFPNKNNLLFFKDTTPCTDADYNIEYEVVETSLNCYTGSIEKSKLLFSPAYGQTSKYAIFNVCTEKYYETPITDIHPLIDTDLIKPKINGCYERDYTIAIIGADKCWKRYMVLAVINQYDNFFCGNEHIVWILTRDANPDWSIYNDALNDIQNSKLNPNHLISIDQSSDSLPIPLNTLDDIDGVIKQTSVSTTSETRSVHVSDSDSSSTTTSTTVQTSTVVFEINQDFTSEYNFVPCDLYDGIQILKGLDSKTLRRALSGKYYMSHATPCSFYDGPDSKVGILNTCGCSMQMLFDDDAIDSPWDYNTHHMVMDRGINLKTGEVQQTRSYISSVYPEDHQYGQSVLAFYSEGYYPKSIEEYSLLSLDGMICKQPSDIYKNQIIASIVGYKDNDYIMFCVANKYKNQFCLEKPISQVIVYTRQANPSQETLKCITQELLRCGYNPNYLVNIDQSRPIDDVFTFDKSYYESQTTTISTTRSIVSTRGLENTIIVDNDSPTSELPSIIPRNWHVKTFDSQYATIALQGLWHVQMGSPTLIKGNNPLKTGLFCNGFPNNNNQLYFKDTTPCTDADYNIEYKVIESSHNCYTDSIENTKLLFSPAYGPKSKYAIFNVCTGKYYETPITDIHPLIDTNLIKPKINGCYERDYTIAIIGADKCWESYMVLAVINQYDNFFCGNEHIVWILTRDANPDWSIYNDAFNDIQNSNLNYHHLISFEQSPNALPIPSDVSDEIDGVIKQTSVSTTSETRSVHVSDSDSSSTTTSTTVQTSTVVFEINQDFTSEYNVVPCDLYDGIQILKGLDSKTLRRALSGQYYMSYATPSSFFDSPDSRVGILNTCGCSMQLLFDDDAIDSPWDYNTHHMVMDRGINMKTGKVEQTRSYISSVYPEDHQYGQSVLAFYSEGYYPDAIKECSPLSLDGVICKQPSDIYKNQFIASIVGYKDNDYIIFCLANKYKNQYFNDSDQIYQLYAYTRQSVPSSETIKSMTQDFLRCGYNPNYLMRIDQTRPIEDSFVFERTYFESTTSCWSSSSSTSVSSSTATVSSSSSSSSDISITCK